MASEETIPSETRTKKRIIVRNFMVEYVFLIALREKSELLYTSKEKVIFSIY